MDLIKPVSKFKSLTWLTDYYGCAWFILAIYILLIGWLYCERAPIIWLIYIIFCCA